MLRDTELVRWLTRRPATLDREVRDRLVAAMRRRETWGATSGSTSESDVPAFTALRREVAAARRVRLLWATSALLGVVAVAGTVAVNAYSVILGG